MLPVEVPNWVARPPMVSVPMVGHYVRIDPLDLKQDTPLLWDALGGNDGSINERVKWWGMDDFKSPTDLSNILQSIDDAEGWGVNVFRLASDNQVAGMASYICTNAEHGRTEVGYVAHGNAMARTPAATEAHYLLAKHALEGTGYRRLEWKCNSNNMPSNQAAKRYGYTFEGCFRQHKVTVNGNNRDTNWYSMLDSEWPHRKASFEAWLDPSNFDEGGLQKQSLKDL